MVDSVDIVISSFISALFLITGFILGERQSKNAIYTIVLTVLQALKLQNHPNIKNATINRNTIQIELGDTTTTLNR